VGGTRFFVLILSRYFIRVNPCPKEFGVCRGALLRAPTEFGAKGDKALLLTLGTYFIRVYPCSSVSH
jgi:hypothetical protein